MHCRSHITNTSRSKHRVEDLMLQTPACLFFPQAQLLCLIPEALVLITSSNTKCHRNSSAQTCPFKPRLRLYGREKMIHMKTFSPAHQNYSWNSDLIRSDLSLISGLITMNSLPSPNSRSGIIPNSPVRFIISLLEWEVKVHLWFCLWGSVNSCVVILWSYTDTKSKQWKVHSPWN